MVLRQILSFCLQRWLISSVVLNKVWKCLYLKCIVSLKRMEMKMEFFSNVIVKTNYLQQRRKYKGTFWYNDKGFKWEKKKKKLGLNGQMQRMSSLWCKVYLHDVRWRHNWGISNNEKTLPFHLVRLFWACKPSRYSSFDLAEILQLNTFFIRKWFTMDIAYLQFV